MSMTFNGKPFNANSFQNELMSAAVDAVKEELFDRFASRREPRSGEFPTVRVFGDELDDIRLKIEGSQALIEHIELGLEPEDQSGPSQRVSSVISKIIGSEKLIDGVSLLADAGLNIGTEVLEGFPLVGSLVNGLRAFSEVKNSLELRKIEKFLQGVAQADYAKRKQFTDGLRTSGELESFGENILLLMSRLDDMSKPGIVGRVLSVHIEGHIDYEKAMRLAAIVDRSYASDLTYLKSFTPGVQREGTDIAAMLFSVGLLRSAGFDGGLIGDDLSGGTLYDLNEYGKILLEYGWR
ncbi:hypothetical protein ACFYE9_32470 [Rhizobium leguminosarum]|nr:hypothetical protein [Rhizobium leguminosarum]